MPETKYSKSQSIRTAAESDGVIGEERLDGYNAAQK
jgi:hypothetical protein